MNKQVKYNLKCRLRKKFGFIPKIRLYNKNITSDGLLLGEGNAVVLKHFANKDMLNKVKDKHQKAMWVYKKGRETGFYTIQIVDVITKEEYWIDFIGTSDKLIEFFNKLKSYPVNYIKNWMEVQE